MRVSLFVSLSLPSNQFAGVTFDVIDILHRSFHCSSIVLIANLKLSHWENDWFPAVCCWHFVRIAKTQFHSIYLRIKSQKSHGKSKLSHPCLNDGIRFHWINRIQAHIYLGRNFKRYDVQCMTTDNTIIISNRNNPLILYPLSKQLYMYAFFEQLFKYE